MGRKKKKKTILCPLCRGLPDVSFLFLFMLSD